MRTILIFAFLLVVQSVGLKLNNDPESQELEETANRILTQPFSEHEMTEVKEAWRLIRNNVDDGSGTALNEKRDHLKVCSGFEYAQGSWKELDEKPKKSFVCCDGWQRDQIEHPDICGTFDEESWEIKFLGSIGQGYPQLKSTLSGSNGCNCEPEWAQRLDVTQREMYEWQPSNCVMEAFNADKFCALLGNRRVLILGDSTGNQAQNALQNMVLSGSVSNDITCAERIGHSPSDALTGTIVLDPGYQDWTDRAWVNRYWVDDRHPPVDLEKLNADIVVFAIGPHFHSLDTFNYMLEKVAAKVRAYRSSSSKPVQFFWKTISGAGCGPINTAEGIHNKSLWAWDLFPSYDERARQMMANLSIPVIDVSPLYLRGDGHGRLFMRGNDLRMDCLHFCQPGPLNIFGRIFQHVLQETEMKEAQEQ